MLKTSDIAEFNWGFGKEWFLRTNKGNFIWSDPEYGGDNTIVFFSNEADPWVAVQSFCDRQGISFVRDKGIHSIEGYCGPEVKIH